ncbi:uncharacterized protein Z520_02562 [Fonsecaea multimorphosa CBS 102226]|uniref:Uncharacterized protein n=1 Tax=Fonsecaea multimorphosa CBS 102226 TaxID=1442371 RepID=A0A0D2K8Q4_9EURO|nr:uncharacterized protein Z520_02562 [Fonsecaea multimorphosa CBS 102226]KIY02423.1 hypothetical protein Z520_02562 [Fonsecaea multimorphosa CBS 102226]OAL29064.1 hypothetical protein AYO22_02501 [Fonsecaea multimorphosa]
MAGKKPLKDAAKSNPTALGDPVSLKAEQSDTSPTHQPQQKADRSPSLKERAEQDLNEAKKGNRSMLGDPVSLKAETSEGDPVRDADENEDGTGRSSGARKGGKGRDSKL